MTRYLLRITAAFLLLSILPGFLTAEENQGTGLNKTPEKLYNSVKEVRLKSTDTPLPSSVDWSNYMPRVGYQGQQGSCVAWAVSYNKIFHEKRERDWDVNDREHRFSPAFIYNQINHGRDQGSYIGDALELGTDKGYASLKTMPYNERDFRTQPSSRAFTEARLYKSQSYARLDLSGHDELKKILADGNCIIFGMEIYYNFYSYRSGIYKTPQGSKLGGHAMLIVGYSDKKGAYKILNSWGTQWGINGYAWIDYETLLNYTVSAWIMHDLVEYTPEEEPESPKTLTASEGAYEDRIRLAWEPVSNAKSYIVYRSESSRESYEEIGRTQASSFFDIRVVPGTHYDYSVISVGENGNSDYSPVVSGFALKKQKPKPGVPQNVQVRQEDGVVYIRWDQVENVKAYKIYRFDFDKEDFVLFGKTLINNFKDKRVEEETPYHYAVTAQNDNGESDLSTSVLIVIEKKKINAPLTPQNFAATRGTAQGKVIISWDAEPETDYYYLYRWNPGNDDWSLIGKTTRTNFTDKKVSESIIYNYHLRAFNQGGYSEPTDMATGWIRMTIKPPSSTAEVKASTSKDKVITVTWETAENANGYYVKKSFAPKNGKGEGRTILSTIGPFTETSFTDKDVADGYVYTYEVIPYNEAGESDPTTAEGWTKGTEENKKEDTYYSNLEDEFESIRDRWDYRKFDDKFYEYIDEAFNELDREVDQLRKERKKSDAESELEDMMKDF